MTRSIWKLIAMALISIAASGQTNPVYQSPTGSQAIVQPPNTNFSANNEAGIVYAVPSYNWTQQFSQALAAGQMANVKLNSCPAGLWVPPPLPSGANPFTRILLVGAGGSPKEVVVLIAPSTGDTPCPLQGGISGGPYYVAFTPQDSYPNGFTLSSASQGLQEAINAANFTPNNYTNSPQLGNVVIPPGEYATQARISILGSKQHIDAGGAVLTCNVADTCLGVGDIPVNGSSNPNFTIDVTIDGLAVRPGYAGKYSAIEDNGQHTTIRGISPRNSAGGSAPPSFYSLVQVDNDQAAVIEKFNADGNTNWAHCGADWCSVVVYGPGGAGNSGVLWVKDSVLGWQCAFNGIDNQDGNTLRVSDSIVQANPQFSIRARGSNNNPSAILDNVYFDPGDCVKYNPLGLGVAGLISEGFVSVVHGMQPSGALPVFATSQTVTTTYAYYIVIHNSNNNNPIVSAPFLAGYAQVGTSLTPITVLWPQVTTGLQNANITYDLLRQDVTQTQLDVNQPAPYGTASSIATGISGNCSNGICSVIDRGVLSSYTVTAPSTYAPALTFWPGAVILTEPNDSATNNGAEPRLYSDIVGQTGIPGGGYVNSYGANVPTVFAHQCSVPGAWSSIWMSCPAGDSVSNNYKPIGALLLQAGIEGSDSTQGGLKGRLNLMSPSGTLPATHLITLGDSNPAKTLATPAHRPTNDANDTWIGLDNPNAIASQFQLAFGAPQFISSYIGNTGDNANWLERLQTGLKTFAVPVSSTVRQGTPPFQVVSSTPVGTLTLSNHPLLQNCVTGQNMVNCQGTQTHNGQIVFGSIQLSSGTATLQNLSPAFSVSANCVANDTTNVANGVKAVPNLSQGAIVFTGTGSDFISYQCVGS
jgi:hypothetical protein